MNLYQYGNGNPLIYFDPSGLSSLFSAISGGLRIIGGGFEVFAGLALAFATGWTGVGAVAGVLVALHGLDQIGAGIAEIAVDHPVDSLTSQGLQALGMSKTAANLTDMGISIVGSLGSSLYTTQLKLLAVVAADEAMAEGLGPLRLIRRYDIGSQALKHSEYLRLGGETTTALEKAMLIEHGIDAAGNPLRLTTNIAQRLWWAAKLIGTGPTPGGYLSIGITGAVGAGGYGLRRWLLPP
jgi:hypothetical protein